MVLSRISIIMECDFLANSPPHLPLFPSPVHYPSARIPPLRSGKAQNPPAVHSVILPPPLFSPFLFPYTALVDRLIMPQKGVVIGRLIVCRLYLHSFPLPACWTPAGRIQDRKPLCRRALFSPPLLPSLYS